MYAWCVELYTIWSSNEFEILRFKTQTPVLRCTLSLWFWDTKKSFEKLKIGFYAVRLVKYCWVFCLILSSFDFFENEDDWTRGRRRRRTLKVIKILRVEGLKSLSKVNWRYCGWLLCLTLSSFSKNSKRTTNHENKDEMKKNKKIDQDERTVWMIFSIMGGGLLDLISELSAGDRWKISKIRTYVSSHNLSQNTKKLSQTHTGRLGVRTDIWRYEHRSICSLDNSPLTKRFGRRDVMGVASLLFARSLVQGTQMFRTVLGKNSVRSYNRNMRYRRSDVRRRVGASGDSRWISIFESNGDRVRDHDDLLDCAELER